MLPGFTPNLGAYLRRTSAGSGGTYTGPVFLSNTTAQASTVTAGSISASAAPYSVILLFSAAEPNSASAPSITSMSGLGLVWTRRVIKSYTNQSGTANSEIWYAINNSASTVSGTISTTYSSTVDDLALVAANYNNCNLTNPWSTSATGTASGYGLTTPSVVLNTDRANSLGILWWGATYASTFGTPTGWTSSGSVQNNGATYWMYSYTNYQQFSTQQTSLTITSSVANSSANSGWFAIADSLVS